MGDSSKCIRRLLTVGGRAVAGKTLCDSVVLCEHHEPYTGASFVTQHNEGIDAGGTAGRQ
jgi:hypothetical protein